LADSTGAGGFPTTHWSLVFGAGDPADPGSRVALEALCRDYWYPLYAFARRRGLDPGAAEDLVQATFVRLIEGNDFARLDPARGRLRSFLMAACSHVLANQRDRERAWKRGGGRAPISIDRPDAEGRYALEPSHELTPERLFERRWALILLERALGRLGEEMAEAGKSELFARLRPTLAGGGEAVSHGDVARALGLGEGAVKMAALRLRRRYREVLRDEVAGTLSDPAEVEDEILAMLAALGC
jgi:RNA polymerase sigma factor (sigma-70 family)